MKPFECQAVETSDEAKKLRRVFGRGMREGLRIAGIKNVEDHMNNSRLASLEQGLPGIARKVLEAIPYDAAWTTAQVITEIRRSTGSLPDKTTVDGCIFKLLERKVIREVRSGHYSRVAHKAPPPPADEKISHPLPAPKPAVPTVEVEEGRSTMDRLADIAVSLRGLAEEAETIALDIEAQMQRARTDTAKFRQLQELLKN